MLNLADSDIARRIEGLLADRDFRDLELSRRAKTLFDVVGKSQDESTHSRILAWLLDPSQDHGFGSRILRDVLAVLARAARSKDIRYPDGSGEEVLDPLHAAVLTLNDVDVRTEHKFSSGRRLDIVACSRDEQWLLIVENKIGAAEGEQQTTDYYTEAAKMFPPEHFRNRLFAYLTPDGRRPVSKHFVPVTYREVAEALASVPGEGASALGRLVLDQYNSQLLEANMAIDTRKLKTICRQLYRQHKDAIDTILQYGSENALGSDVFEKVLESLEQRPIETPDGRRLRWASSVANTKTWYALWPAHWPTARGRYDAYYTISAPRSVDEIKIALGFDRRELLHQYEELAR